MPARGRPNGGVYVMCVVGTMLLAGVGASSDAAATSPARYPPIQSTVPFPPGCTHPGTVSTVPDSEVDALQGEVASFVEEEAPKGVRQLDGIGTCAPGTLVLTLTPGSEALAKKVRARFGTAVQILVGESVWSGKPGTSPTCGTLAARSSGQPYVARLKLSGSTLRTGASISGNVAFTDRTSQSVTVDTASPIEVVLTAKGTRKVVGLFSGAIAGTEHGFTLAPGETRDVPVVGGTARCDGGVGSTLPSGRYDAIAEVSGPGVTGMNPDGSPTPTYFTNRVAITVK